MTHGMPIRRLCTEFGNINASRIHDVSVVCARSSTSSLTGEFSDMLWSSLYGARLYSFTCYIHWSSLYGVRQYQCASYCWCCGRLWTQLDFCAYVWVLRYHVVVSVWSSILLLYMLHSLVVSVQSSTIGTHSSFIMFRSSVHAARLFIIVRKLLDFMWSCSCRAQHSKKYEFKKDSEDVDQNPYESMGGLRLMINIPMIL